MNKLLKLIPLIIILFWVGSVSTEEKPNNDVISIKLEVSEDKVTEVEIKICDDQASILNENDQNLDYRIVTVDEKESVIDRIEMNSVNNVIQLSIPYNPKIARLYLYDIKSQPEKLLFTKNITKNLYVQVKKALYFGDAGDDVLLYLGVSGNRVIQTLRSAGFNITVASELDEKIITDLKKYQLIVVVKYEVCCQKLANALKEFVAQGGGVMLYGGVPAVLPHPKTPADAWHNGFKNIEYISEWFGAGGYENIGGKASLVQQNPFNTRLPKDTVLNSVDGRSNARIIMGGINKKTKVIARWQSGDIYAFTHNYKDGRVYYQAYLGGEIELELFRGGCIWATNLLPTVQLTPELTEKINKLINELGNDDWEIREKATNSLIDIGEAAIPLLKKAKDSPDAEVRVRIKHILELTGQ